MHRFIPLTLLLSLTGTSVLIADEVPTDLLARYVNNDTVVVATARVEPALLAQLQAFAQPQMATPVDRAVMEKLAPILELWGDRRVFVIGSLADAATGPMIVTTAAPGEDADMLNSFAEKLRAQLNQGSKFDYSNSVRVVDSKALLVGSVETLSRYETLQPQPRPELLDKLAELVQNDSPVAAVLAPGPDARRVLREMWPQLPSPFNAVTGPLLADRVRQITFAAQLPPDWSAELAIHTTDEEAAETLAQSGQRLVAQFAPLIQSQLPMEGIDWPEMMESVTPQRDGAAVKLTVRHDDAAIAKAVAELASTAVSKARKDAQRSQRMNQFKQLALAFHNFHGTQKSFPSSATICDKDGKPLLSWRVAILPYLGTDANELFNQFHFDEPWDSEHNLKLLEKMPEVYADAARPDHGGKTTYLLPVHPETTFPPADETPVAESTLNGRKLFLRPGFSYRDITDGTSQTIMIVEVAPDQAVPWTKPADWEVDLANPVKGLKQEGRDGFVCAYCDGSAHFNQFSIEPEMLRALLTRAGKEVISYSDGKARVTK